MKKYFPLAFLALALLISGCAEMGTMGEDSVTSDIKVSAQTDDKANLSGYKSYSWIAVGAVLNDPEGKWQPPGFKAGEEIKNLIDDQMKNKGYMRKDDAADLGVAFFLGIDMEARKFKMNPETKMKEMQDVAKAALVVVLVDTRTGFIVWIGEASRSATKTVTGRNKVDDEKIRKRIHYAVTEMFKQM